MDLSKEIIAGAQAGHKSTVNAPVVAAEAKKAPEQKRAVTERRWSAADSEALLAAGRAADAESDKGTLNHRIRTLRAERDQLVAKQEAERKEWADKVKQAVALHDAAQRNWDKARKRASEASRVTGLDRTLRERVKTTYSELQALRGEANKLQTKHGLETSQLGLGAILARQEAERRALAASPSVTEAKRARQNGAHGIELVNEARNVKELLVANIAVTTPRAATTESSNRKSGISRVIANAVAKPIRAILPDFIAKRLPSGSIADRFFPEVYTFSQEAALRMALGKDALDKKTDAKFRAENKSDYEATVRKIQAVAAKRDIQYVNSRMPDMAGIDAIMMRDILISMNDEEYAKFSAANNLRAQHEQEGLDFHQKFAEKTKQHESVVEVKSTGPQRTEFAERQVERVKKALRDSYRKLIRARKQEFAAAQEEQLQQVQDWKSTDPEMAGAEDLLVYQVQDEVAAERKAFVKANRESLRDERAGIIGKIQKLAARTAARISAGVAAYRAKPEAKTDDPQVTEFGQWLADKAQNAYQATRALAVRVRNKKNLESQYVFEILCDMAVNEHGSNWPSSLEANLKNSYLWNEANLDVLVRTVDQASYKQRGDVLVAIGTMVRGNPLLITRQLFDGLEQYTKAVHSDAIRGAAIGIRNYILRIEPSWRPVGYAESMLSIATDASLYVEAAGNGLGERRAQNTTGSDAQGLQNYDARRNEWRLATREAALDGFNAFIGGSLPTSSDARDADVAQHVSALYEIVQKDPDTAMRIQAMRSIATLLGHAAPVELVHVIRALEIAEHAKHPTNAKDDNKGVRVAALKCALDLIAANVDIDPLYITHFNQKARDDISRIARGLVKGNAEFIRTFEAQTGLKIPGYMQVGTTIVALDKIDAANVRERVSGEKNLATISSLPDEEGLTIESAAVTAASREQHGGNKVTGVMSVKPLTAVVTEAVNSVVAISDERSRAARMANETVMPLVRAMQRATLEMRGVPEASGQTAATALKIVQTITAAIKTAEDAQEKKLGRALEKEERQKLLTKFMPLEGLKAVLCTPNFLESLAVMVKAEPREASGVAAIRSVISLLDIANFKDEKRYIKAIEALVDHVRNSTGVVNIDILRVARQFQEATGIQFDGIGFNRVVTVEDSILQKNTGVVSVETAFVVRKNGSVVVRATEVKGEDKPLVEQNGDVVEVFNKLANQEGVHGTLAVKELVPGLIDAVFNAAVKTPESMDETITRLGNAIRAAGTRFNGSMEAFDQRHEIHSILLWRSGLLAASRETTLPVAANEEDKVVKLDLFRKKGAKLATPQTPAVPQVAVEAEVATSNFFAVYEPTAQGLKTHFVAHATKESLKSAAAKTEWLKYNGVTLYDMLARIDELKKPIQALAKRRSKGRIPFAEEKAEIERILDKSYTFVFQSLEKAIAANDREAMQNWSSGIMLLLQRDPTKRTEKNIQDLLALANTSVSDQLQLKIVKFAAQAMAADGTLRTPTLRTAINDLMTNVGDKQNGRTPSRTLTLRSNNTPKIRAA